VASIRKPENWDQIVAFAQMPPGTGNSEKRIAARPSLTESRAAFHDLLHKIRFSECRINDGYLKALGLHQ
jgi:hypothetical protein